MSRNILMSAVAIIALGSLLAAAPAPAGAGEAQHQATHAEFAQAASVVYGPYATIRRANEVANYARSLGYSALVYPVGDEYYVRVW